MHAYIDAHIQILIDKRQGDGVQAISRLQSQCSDMTFAEKIRYNRLFQQVMHKGWESAIIYIKIFQSAEYLIISVGNSYSEYQLMQNFLENLRQGGNNLLR